MQGFPEDPCPGMRADGLLPAAAARFERQGPKGRVVMPVGMQSIRACRVFHQHICPQYMPTRGRKTVHEPICSVDARQIPVGAKKAAGLWSDGFFRVRGQGLRLFFAPAFASGRVCSGLQAGDRRRAVRHAAACPLLPCYLWSLSSLRMASRIPVTTLTCPTMSLT